MLSYGEKYEKDKLKKSFAKTEVAENAEDLDGLGYRRPFADDFCTRETVCGGYRFGAKWSSGFGGLVQCRVGIGRVFRGPNKAFTKYSAARFFLENGNDGRHPLMWCAKHAE